MDWQSILSQMPYTEVLAALLVYAAAELLVSVLKRTPAFIFNKIVLGAFRWVLDWHALRSYFNRLLRVYEEYRLTHPYAELFATKRINPFRAHHEGKVADLFEL